MPVDLSFVLTVYNKQAYLADTIASLRDQRGDFTREYLFVDDCSTDDSITVIEKQTQGMANVTIIRNTDNMGPSVRLNQGARHARGDYLYLLDADDIIPTNAAEKMLALLKKERADIIYGQCKKCHGRGEHLLGATIQDDPPYTVSDRPLEYILKGGFVRMGLMTTKSLYAASGGCDERIFIQDESLPIRLCAKANMLIDYSGIVLYWIAQGEGKASANEVQLHHDGFLAYRHAVDEIRPMPKSIKNRLMMKMVSVTWKSARIVYRHPYFTTYFTDYLISKIRKTATPQALERANLFFSRVSGIRRLDS
ncbi:glycosyltransferase family 2 protein [Desulfatitalea alkaliphila]|uniref:Glycosyltransferase n=1 Tax=Desulfatitalea alkaliphila TaxID=2929485 RepID=A0AA41R474_9BACT|nr:glycosyltransferase [Desulfatitalea alkaliphila]MCJ8500740.1 glycosyltransferase [Desulfatitalea alkaliphila]